MFARRSLHLFIVVLILGTATSSARAMPFVLPHRTLAEDLADADFVLVGMLYDGKPEQDKSEASTEIAVLGIIKDHASLKNKKHLTLNRYVPTKRSAKYYILFGEMWKGKVDLSRGIRCSGPKDELVRYLTSIRESLKVAKSAGLDFYWRHLEHRNSEIAEDAYHSFRRETYAELERASKYFDPAKLKRWVADEKVPDHRKKLYKVLLSFCEAPGKD